MRHRKIYLRFFGRYRAFLEKKNFRNAQKVLDEMKSLFPSHVWYNQGLLIGTRAYYEKTGIKTVPEQLACFKKSLEFNPHYESAWRSMGTCYVALKQYTKAEDAFRKSLTCARNDIFRGDAYRYLSDVALKVGDAKKHYGF